MVQFVEMDRGVTLSEQLQDQDGPVILINKFDVDAADVEQFLAEWADDAAYFQRQPGFIAAQLHRGIAGSGVFLNYAVWESTAHFRRAFTDPEFRAKLDHYPAGVVGSPHLFRKVAVAGICVE